MRKRAFLHAGIVLTVLLVMALVYSKFFVSAQDSSRIQYGETVSGTIDDTDRSDTWLFEGIEGDIIEIQLARTEGVLTPTVALTSPDDTLLINLEWPDQSTSNIQFSAELQQSGTYTLEIRESGVSTGTYGLSLTLQAEANQIDNNGGILTYGRTIQGEITDEIFRQSWVFRGTRGDIVDIRMTSVAGTLNSYVALITQDGVTIASAESGTSLTEVNLYSVRLPVNGIYTIVARRAGAQSGERGTTQGIYNLLLTLRIPGDTNDQPSPMTMIVGEATTGRLTPNAPTALYSINSAGIISIGLTTSNTTEIYNLNILSSDGGLMRTFSGISPLRTSLVISGTVLLEISSMTVNTPIDFVIFVDQVNTTQRVSQALLYDRPRELAADPTTERPVSWHFAGSTGDIVELTVSPFGTLIDGLVEVFAPDGSSLIQHTIRNGFTQPLMLNGDGLYEIQIDPQIAQMGYRIRVDRTGVSGLSFEQHVQPENAGILQSDSSVTGNVSDSHSQSWILDVPEPQRWHFNLVQNNPNSLLALQIEMPDGTPINTAATGSSIPAALLSAGRYQLVVFDPTGQAQDSAYTLSARLDQGGSLPLDTLAKGILTSTVSTNTWTLNTYPGTLLDIQIETLSGENSPYVHVIGANGLLITSSTQQERQDPTDLLSIPLEEGGPIQIIVGQNQIQAPIVYHITARIETPFQTHPVIYSTEPTLIPIVSHSTDEPVRVSIADQITIRIAFDSAKATNADFGTLIRGEIPDNSIYQMWSFSVFTNQMVSISALAVDAQATPDLQLMTSDGSILVEKFQSDSTSVYLSHRFATSGTYYAVVRLDPLTRYLFRMDLQRDIDETLPTVLDGRVLDFGETLIADLNAPEDQETFLFYGHEGDVISARAIAISGNLLPRLVLSDGNGVLLNNSESGSISHLQLQENGIYQIIISPSNNEIGQFALHLNLEVARQATEYGGGRLIFEGIGGLGGEDLTQHWLFDAQAGERVTIRVEPFPNSIPDPFMLQLTDTNGHPFLQTEGQLGQDYLELTDVLLPRSGIYQAVVTGGQQNPGIYRVTYDRDTHYIQDLPGIIRYGETVGKVLTPTNFLDDWTFTGSQGDEISIATRTLRGDAAFVSFQLRASNGQILATAVENSTTTSARADHIVLPADGHYTVLVGNMDNTFSGETAYEVTLLLENSLARSAGSALNYGQTATGMFYVTDKTDTWIFYGNQGDSITVSVNGPGATLTLLSTDWHTNGPAEILASAQAINDTATLENYILPAMGAYVISVQGSSFGAYTLRLESDRNSQPDAIPLVFDRTESEQITSSDLVDFWSFDGQQNTTVTIAVLPDSRASLAPTITLIDPSGSIVAQTASAMRGETRINAYPLTVSGKYIVRITRSLGIYGSTDGDYTINLQEADLPIIEGGQTIYGQLERSLLDDEIPSEKWSFAGEAGDTIRIRAEATSGTLDATLRLLDMNEVLLASEDDEYGLDPEINFTLPTTGTYTVEVGRYGNTTDGNYSLLIERTYRSNGETSEPLLLYGDSIRGTTDSITPNDQWRFNGEQGDTVQARIRFPSDDTPLILSLYDPAGNILAAGVRERDQVIINGYVLPATGGYRLDVSRPGDARSDYSPYVLDLNLLNADMNAPTQGGILTVEEPVKGEFISAPATHMWVFQGQADQSVAFTLNQLRGALNVDLTIVAPSGLSFFTTTSSGNAIAPIRLPETGTYTLLVRSNELSLGSIYRISLQLTATDDNTQELVSDGFGFISNVQPRQSWHFEANAGEVIYLRTGSSNSNFNPTLMIWGPDQRPLQESVDTVTPEGNQSVISGFVIPQSGTYTVTVRGISSNSTGEYRLLLRRQAISSRAATAVDIAFDAPVFGSISASTPQLYAFQGSAGDIIHISAHGAIPPQIALETEDGQTINSDAHTTENERYVSPLILPATGRYIVVLSGETASDYTFAVSRQERAMPNVTAARALEAGFNQADSITDPTQASYWILSGTTGEVYSFTVDTTDGALEAAVTLYGSQGYITSQSERPQTSGVTLGPIRIPYNGQYIIAVESRFGSNTTGRYSIRLDPAEADVSGSNGGTIFAKDLPVTGGLIASDPTDDWTFQGQAGEVIDLTVRTTNENPSITMQLIAPDGSIMGNGDNNRYGTLLSAIMLPSSGQYIVRVDGEVIPDTSIEYSLTLSQVQNPVAASVTQAQGIAYGETKTGILIASTYQAWVFWGQAGESIQSQVQLDSPDVRAVIHLLQPDGTILSTQTGVLPGSSASLSAIILPSNGFYGIVVGSIAPDGYLVSTINYTLSLEKVASGAIEQGVLDDHVQGELSVFAPIQRWSLQPTFSGSYLINARGLVPNLQPYLSLFAANGELLAASADGVLPFDFMADQLYSVVLSGGPSYSYGSYSLDIMPSSFQTGGGDLLPDSANIGRITDEHFTDEWHFQSVSGSRVSVSIRTTNGDLAPYVSIFDPAGALVIESSADTSGVFQFTLDAMIDGQYSILISREGSGAGTTSGDYAIQLTSG